MSIQTNFDFEKLYDEYADKVYAYIVCRIGQHHDAEDLTADVFLKAFSHPYNPGLAKFSTYIFTITANVLKNYYRAAANRRFAVCGEPEEDLPGETDLLTDMVTREKYAELKEALTKLSGRQYAVMFRRYYLEESFGEIGAALGISETNARQIHFEGLKKMRVILKELNS